MKKLIYVLVLLGLIGTLGGSFFKIMHWPGAGKIFVLGHIFFLLGGILWLFSEKREMIMLFLGVTLIILLIMGVFSTMNWPGGQIVRWASIVVTSVFAFTLFTKKE